LDSERWYNRPFAVADHQIRVPQPEKSDMKLPEKGNTAESVAPRGSNESELEMQDQRANPATEQHEVEIAAVVTDLATRRIMRKRVSEPSLRCVSSGYMADGCSCRASIPTGVVSDAWASQQRAGVSGDRMFHFTWRGEVWLAYGLKNGRIRGVYCPTHTAQRTVHSPNQDSGQEGARENLAVTG
jgi:hypothetical protein